MNSLPACHRPYFCWVSHGSSSVVVVMVVMVLSAQVSMAVGLSRPSMIASVCLTFFCDGDCLRRAFFAIVFNKNVMADWGRVSQAYQEHKRGFESMGAPVTHRAVSPATSLHHLNMSPSHRLLTMPTVHFLKARNSFDELEN